MRPISARVHRLIDASPYHKRCARAAGGGCSGRLTMEHALLFAGQQVDEAWAIVPLCWHHHLGPGLDKRLNELLALRRATPEDLAKYPKARGRWEQLRKYLETRYASGQNHGQKS